MARLECDFCGCYSAEPGKGWAAVRRYDTQGTDGLVVAVFCPPCAAAEFGHRPELAAKYVCVFDPPGASLPSKVAGYVRVSSEQQAESGAGLLAQRRAIQRETDRRGWELVEIFQDAGASGKHVHARPGLSAALEALESHHAETLMVAKLDRLSRSLVDFAALMDRSRRMNWDIVALDLGVDTSTPSGEMMANVLAVFAQFERRLIGERTREALAAKRTQGVRLGRPPSLQTSVRHRIAQERTRGATLASIAERLNAEGVPTAQGGQRWYPATIRKILTANP